MGGAKIAWAYPRNACSAIQNTDKLKGSIAVVDRGTCPLIDKVEFAQAAGAVAIVIINQARCRIERMQHWDSRFRPYFQKSTHKINIPAVMVGYFGGKLLEEA